MHDRRIRDNAHLKLASGTGRANGPVVIPSKPEPGRMPQNEPNDIRPFVLPRRSLTEPLRLTASEAALSVRRLTPAWPKCRPAAHHPRWRPTQPQASRVPLREPLLSRLHPRLAQASTFSSTGKSGRL